MHGLWPLGLVHLKEAMALNLLGFKGLDEKGTGGQPLEENILDAHQMQQPPIWAWEKLNHASIVGHIRVAPCEVSNDVGVRGLAKQVD